MRIHQKIKIARSTDVPRKSDYHDYMPFLQEDFHHICGYCGKSDHITRCMYEIDHLVPVIVDNARKIDYSNLVYACFQCNRKKWSKWPTSDKGKHNNGTVGFVDPVEDEFDLHLGRSETGEIEHYSPVGEYMCKEAFMFHLRPMKEIWRAMRIKEIEDMLLAKAESLSEDEKRQLIEIVVELNGLYTSFFSKHE